MKRLKKILYFVLGWVIVPPVLAIITVWLFQIDAFKEIYGYFSLIYLLSYILFPLFYRGALQNKFPNKYAFYAVIYLTLCLLNLLMCFF